ncbi:Tat pathway signal sequence domain protein [Georgenia halophila]|uniref:Tat pathway signal sequence domain protein n=1 Tax=Georgenia halophila TaxID=620889 RepID=A0ABP8LEA5_9MICO
MSAAARPSATSDSTTPASADPGTAAPATTSQAPSSPSGAVPAPTTQVRWLEGPPGTLAGGATWGVPWPRGSVPAGTSFALGSAAGESIPVQSWTTATWPDGSVKWSAHAAAPPSPAAGYALTPGAAPAAPELAVGVTTEGAGAVVDTGRLRAVLPGPGEVIVSSLEREGRPVAVDGRLVSELAEDPDVPGPRGRLRGAVETLTVEQDGPVRAVVLLTGRHLGRADGEGAPSELLPFRVRLYFYAGSDTVRMVHSFVWDGDPERVFLAGLGVRFDVPLRAATHDRHVRLAGSAGGFLTEAVRGVTGLRRNPGDDIKAAQVAGRATPATTEWDEAVSSRLHLVPEWNDWTLTQPNADGYTLRKRTGRGRGWVTVPAGTRAGGYVYLGDVSGGLEMGLRDFWKLHPTQIDVRDAATETGTLTMWLWSPEARPMDLRFYHDGLGQETYADQLDALEITYEDYEPGFGDARGIARTHELFLRGAETTPPSGELAARAAAAARPPVLTVSPERLRAADVFGPWSVVDRSTPARAEIEDRLDFLVDYYTAQVEQRRWYGFWDYGDVMHAYDGDRHTWRYDVGGYAWDNSELSPDLWLWLSFLRSGRPETYRLAEALTRHTSEVDVYHDGPWAGLGTRHNVQHWGCSAKQLRISTPAYRRFFYYLSGDERVGDLLSELADAEQRLLALDPTRKVRRDAYTPDPSAVAVGLGTDYSALLATWLTRWERTGDPSARARLEGTMSDIGALPQGFLTGEALLDLADGRFDRGRDRIAVSHLSAVFGLVEMIAEVTDLLDVPEFEEAWLQYCRLFLATPEEQTAEVGQPLEGISLVQAHSRLAAWAANRTGDRGLARRAWRAFYVDAGDQLNVNALCRQENWGLTRIDGAGVLEPVDEAPYLYTNDAAQYGLAAIQNLALVGDVLEEAHAEVFGSGDRPPHDGTARSDAER